jgi:hypothetical protein
VNAPRPAIVVAAARLRAAVEDTAAALAGAELDRLLASEAELLTVLNDIPRSPSLSVEDGSHLRQEVEHAQTALRRCRRLGSTLNDFVRFSLDAQGQTPGYEPRRTAAPITGRAFSTRA